MIVGKLLCNVISGSDYKSNRVDIGGQENRASKCASYPKANIGSRAHLMVEPDTDY